MKKVARWGSPLSTLAYCIKYLPPILLKKTKANFPKKRKMKSRVRNELPPLDVIFDIEVFSKVVRGRFGEADYLPYMVRAFRVAEKILRDSIGDTAFEEEFEREMRG